MTRSDFNETAAPRVLRMLLTGGASLLAAGVTAALVAVPAMANTGTPKPTPPACTGSALPTATCLPAISGNVVTLPGIGTLNLTLTGTGAGTKITNATLTQTAPSTLKCTVKMDTKDQDRVAVYCLDTTTDTAYKTVVKVGDTGIVTAKLKVRKEDSDKDEHENETKDSEAPKDGTHTFDSGPSGSWTKKD